MRSRLTVLKRVAAMVNVPLAAAALTASGSWAATLIRDNFEYVLTEPDCSQFAAAGWTAQKMNNCNPFNRGGATWTTVSSIPGYAGPFPGTNSTRVLRVHFNPADVPGQPGFRQTDTYLQFGREGGPRAIPANSWFQFWIYVNRSGAEQTRLQGGKVLYVSPDGTYPSNPPWLFDWNASASALPYWTPVTGPGEVFWVQRPPGADYLLDPEYPTNRDKLGPNLGPDGNRGKVSPNQWYLVKVHLDTSGGAPGVPPGQGVWEAWMRTATENSFTQFADWKGSVTPSFSWPSSYTGGFATFRLFTTIQYVHPVDPDGQAWVYMDDMVIASSEADLPTYGAVSGGPASPRGLSVSP